MAGRFLGKLREYRGVLGNLRLHTIAYSKINLNPNAQALKPKFSKTRKAQCLDYAHQPSPPQAANPELYTPTLNPKP